MLAGLPHRILAETAGRRRSPRRFNSKISSLTYIFRCLSGLFCHSMPDKYSAS